jgi:hypothetical protein
VPRNQETAALPPPTPPIAPIVPAPPERRAEILGLGEDAVAELLGQPVRTSESGPSKIWHYAPPTCVLNVVYFFDLTRRGFYVLAFDAGDGVPQEQAEACLRNVARDHARR